MKKKMLSVLIAMVLMLSITASVYAEGFHWTPGSEETRQKCTNTYTNSLHTGSVSRAVKAQHELSNGSICHTTGVYYTHNICCSQCSAILSSTECLCMVTHSNPMCPSVTKYCYGV